MTEEEIQEEWDERTPDGWSLSVERTGPYRYIARMTKPGAVYACGSPLLAVGEARTMLKAISDAAARVREFRRAHMPGA